MERRDVLKFVRVMALSAFGVAVTKRVDIFAAESGTLSCNLGDWKWLVFHYKGRQVTVPMEDVFGALEDVYGSVRSKEPLGKEVQE